MGSITAYEIGSGRRYRVRWRDDQQKQVEKKGFRTKREAELYLAHTAVSRSNGSYTDPGEARITVGALGVEWLRNKKHALKASSFSSLDTSWRVYVLPRWGDVRIGDIRASHVEQWIRELSEGTATTKRTKSEKAGANPRSASVVYARLACWPASSTRQSVTAGSPVMSPVARRICRRSSRRSRVATSHTPRSCDSPKRPTTRHTRRSSSFSPIAESDGARQSECTSATSSFRDIASRYSERRSRSTARSCSVRPRTGSVGSCRFLRFWSSHSSDSAVANEPTISSSPTWRASTCGVRRPSRE